MGVIIKICGISTPEMADVALGAGADMLGFVHFEKSSRHVSLEAAKALSRHVGDKALKVLLTVDMADDALAEAIATVQPHALQLHGRETPERVGAIKARFGLTVIKAIPIGRDPSDLARSTPYAGVADVLLFDAAPAKGAQVPGGTGTAFDWDLLRGLELSTPWLLAGGLTPENVGEALRCTKAPGVDVSSGVESARGVKDAGKIEAFIANARAAADKAPA